MMTEWLGVTEEEWARCENRLQELGQEKARLQLINHMMNQLGKLPGLENTVEAILQSAMDNLGGTNQIVYYCVLDTIVYADVFGKKEPIQVVTDPLVKKVFETRAICTDEHPGIDTRMMFVMPLDTVPAVSLAFPLMVGAELIGVFKMEGMVSGMRVFLTQILQPFLVFAAMVLKNELLNYARLKVAFDLLEAETTERRVAEAELRDSKEELLAINEELSAQNEEIASLNQTLGGMNEELERRVAERTSDLQAAHQELTAQYEELSQTQTALRTSESQMRTLVETIPDLIWLKSPSGVYLSCNKMFEKFFGASEGDIIGKTDYDFVDRDLADFFREKDMAAIAAGKPSINEELLTYASDGHKVSVETIKTPMFDEAGTLVGVLGVAHDITERVCREQEVERDAQLATRVQNALLPGPVLSEYLQVSTIYNPFGYVGGDLYFLDWRYGGNILRGFVVDATGHGLGTALHTASLHVLLREVNERDLPLSEAMRWLNHRAGEYFDEATFAGALGFEMDLELRQLRWVCAGLPEIWVATQTTEGVLTSAGMFLGIQADEMFETNTMPINVGDSFFFMTDGLSDQLQGTDNLPLHRYSDMVELLRTLAKSKERRDDATAVCIHVCALPQSMVRQDGWPRILRFNGYGDYQRFKGEVAKILAELTGLPHSLHEVAVNEALANAMECRDGIPRQHKARLRFNKVGNRLIVRVKTSRMGFAGNAVLRRLRSQPEEMFSFGEDAAMGRGIPMMLSMSHKMTYNSEGTEVLLAWRL